MFYHIGKEVFYEMLPVFLPAIFSLFIFLLLVCMKRIEFQNCSRNLSKLTVFILIFFFIFKTVISCHAPRVGVWIGSLFYFVLCLQWGG